MCIVNVFISPSSSETFLCLFGVFCLNDDTDANKKTQCLFLWGNDFDEYSFVFDCSAFCSKGHFFFFYN